MLESLEKRLQKAKLEKEYEGQIMDFINRGVISKMTDEEIKQNPIGYTIPHNFVIKEGSATTPLRIVTNSSYRSYHSGLSLNDITLKGPSSLNNLINILIRFRGYKVGLVADIKKMYHSVLTHDEQKFLRRILWRKVEVWNTPFQQNPPEVYNFNTIQFGDRPAGCIATTSLRNTAIMNQSLDPEAAQSIVEDSYVDDIVTGAENMDEVKGKIKNIERITEPGGFLFKQFVVSGDLQEEQDLFQGGEIGSKVLGIKWKPEDDTLGFKATINISKRSRGKKMGPDLELEDIYNLKAEDLTKRRLLRVVNSLFDPIGLLSPVTALLKIHMKLTKGFKWDQSLPQEISTIWVKILGSLKKLDVKFPRAVVGDSCSSVTLVGFCDASINAYAAVIYTRYQVKEGIFQSRILVSRNKVSPEHKISVPRLELLSALLLSRIMKTTMAALTNLAVVKIYNLVDSSSTLGMINKQSAALQEYTGVRIGEIKRNTDEISQKIPCLWRWIPREYNIADIPSKGTLDNSILESNYWQEGPTFLKKPEDEWPMETGEDFTAPKEEVKVNTCLIVQGKKPTNLKKNNCLYEMATKCGNLKKLLHVTAWILRLFQHKGRKKTPLDKEDISKAEKFWIEDAMKTSRENLKKGNYKSLRGYLREDNMVVCSGRLASGKIGYDVLELPIIDCKHIYAKLFIKDKHYSYGHMGIDKMMDMSRNKFWIPHSRKYATSVWKSCITCRKIDKKLETQLMGKIKMWRQKPAPVFNTTCIDLFGPMYIKDNVIKRTGRGTTQGKCWGVVYCCPATGALSIDVTEDYSLDSMLQCLRRFQCEHGTPSTIIMDRGSQLKATEKEVAPNWDLIKERMSEINFIFAPTEGHHYVGVAEAFVKKTKRTLETILQREQKMTFGELQTFCKEAKQIINSRPLGPRLSEDPTSAPPLTPNHLLLSGRSTVEVPQGEFKETSLNKRFIFVQNLVTAWWNKWYRNVFSSLLPSYRWDTQRRNLMVGDVVLIHKEGVKRGTYQLGKVKSVTLSKDNLVRKAILEYMVGATKKTVEKAVSSLVLIVPADYRNEDFD